MSERRCFALDLHDDPDLIAEYERRHEPGAVWAEVVRHLHTQGVEEMEIWRTAKRLFMIAQVADDYPRPVEEPPENQRWEEMMWRFQKPLTHCAAGEKWVSMRRIFSLSEQT